MELTYPRESTARRQQPMLTADEIAWGITIVAAWLGLPYLRALLIFILERIYDWFLLFVH
ncbi:hypothetical protein [Chitinophaga alhagiae]|uniref:hypothetical protein n=1 Tax=Chitinophaga alhagiae TaxID=2203219 RepID=UPI0013003FF0|nr:hypothetical protein [Chitinophaga alhagiae]